MTKYKVRYTPEVVRDLEAVWDGSKPFSLQ